MHLVCLVCFMLSGGLCQEGDNRKGELGNRARRVIAQDYTAAITLLAARPFGPCVMVNSTR